VRPIERRRSGEGGPSPRRAVRAWALWAGGGAAALIGLGESPLRPRLSLRFALRVRGGERLTTQRGSGSPTESGIAERLPDCVGFRVDTALGPIGVVEELRRQESRISELVVRAGKRGSRLLIFPASDITQVLPANRRVTLRPSFHLAASEALSDRARARRKPGLSADS
jgi:hypothetical protein